jgi:diaminohydroxyphosphoribosylaminopyrimidine deaminase/5-amino-6-(5-phosphoribosylamino)uracil reductase
VGAVIVKGRRIVAEGWHRRCGADHAEIVALKKAGPRARGASLYVTLEPCSHYGRTPPCVNQIMKSGIRKVYIGMKDPNPVNNGKSIRMLNKAGIKTTCGFWQKELRKMNEPFVKYITTRMPWVVAKCAQTLDGKIATSQGESKWITSPQSRKYARRLRNDVDAILVGINTILKDNPALNASRRSKHLKKIIVDTSLRIPLQGQWCRHTKPSDIMVATTSKASPQKVRLLKKRGIEVFICPQKQGRVHLKWLLQQLAQKEIASVLIEGGSQIIGAALQEKLIDKFLLFIAPKIMGDQQALSAIRGRRISRLKQSILLNDITFQKIGPDILIEGYVCKDGH